jgi:hypothetical protein
MQRVLERWKLYLLSCGLVSISKHGTNTGSPHYIAQPRPVQGGRYRRLEGDPRPPGRGRIAERAGGIHVVVNALSSDVKQYLSQPTGHAVPPPRPTAKEAKLSTSEWRQVKTRMDKVFDELNRSGLVAIQDAGYTQEDGPSDCAEEFERRGGVGAGLIGACYYTRQDLNRAKRTRLLLLAFSGGQEGGDGGIVSVGNRIVEILKAHNFVVEWTGTADERPTVHLHESMKGSDAR